MLHCFHSVPCTHKGFIASRCVGSCSLCIEAVIWGLAKLLHNFNETGANPATPEEAARALLIHTRLNIVPDCTYVVQGKLSTADWYDLQFNYCKLKMKVLYWLRHFLFSHINFQPTFASILYNSWTNNMVCYLPIELISCQDAFCVARSIGTVLWKHQSVSQPEIPCLQDITQYHLIMRRYGKWFVPGRISGKNISVSSNRCNRTTRVHWFNLLDNMYWK